MYSGQSFQHGVGGDCPDADVFVYDTQCDTWLHTNSPLVKLFKERKPDARLHAAVAHVVSSDAVSVINDTAPVTKPPTSAWAFGGFGLRLLDDAVEVRLPNCSEAHGSEDSRSRSK